MLSIITHEVNTPHPGFPVAQFADLFPALVPAAVIDQNQLIALADLRENNPQSLNQCIQRLFAVINRHNNRYGMIFIEVCWGIHGRYFTTLLSENGKKSRFKIL